MEVVSVIIPAYNAARTLARTLASAQAQTRPPDEIIVVDDGSTDDTGQLVSETFPQVRYHRHDNCGPSASRNVGATLATGNLFAFLDSDDEWAPTKLERQLAVLRDRPEFAAVATHRVRVVVDAAGKELSRTPSKFADGTIEEVRFKQVFWGNRICGPSILMRRESFERAGGYDVSLGVAEDHDLWLRMLGSGDRLGILREALHLFTDRAGSQRSRLDLREQACRAILQRWDPVAHPELQSLLSAAEFARTAQWWWLKLAFHSLLAGERAGARRCAQTAATYRSGDRQLQLANLLALRSPGLFLMLGKAKGFPRTTG